MFTSVNGSNLLSTAQTQWGAGDATYAEGIYLPIEGMPPIVAESIAIISNSIPQIEVTSVANATASVVAQVIVAGLLHPYSRATLSL